MDEPPPSDSGTLPPPSPSVNEDDDTMDEDTESERKAKRVSRKDRDSMMGKKSSSRTSIMSDGLDPKLVKMTESLASIEDDEDDDIKKGMMRVNPRLQTG